MYLNNIAEHLTQDIAKLAADKEGAMMKSIPMQGGPSGVKPTTASPKKAIEPVKPTAARPASPTSYGGLDLMAPPITPSGSMKTPGAAFTDNLANPNLQS